jgi:hypothetical protein
VALVALHMQTVLTQSLAQLHQLAVAKEETLVIQLVHQAVLVVVLELVVVALLM